MLANNETGIIQVLRDSNHCLRYDAALYIVYVVMLSGPLFMSVCLDVIWYTVFVYTRPTEHFFPVKFCAKL